MADLNERICIIGGGPAGVAAAMYLEKKGYKNYVIYEKDNRVGGKCYSPKMKMGPGNKEERTVEMGAIMGAKTYYAVHECEEFGGVSHADGPSMSRIYRDSNGKQIYPFEVKKDFSFKKLFSLLKLKKAVKRLAKIMETKYAGYDVNGHRGIAEGRYDGLDKTYGNDMKHVEGTNENLKDLALPFTEFCKLNKVEPVMRVWIAPFTSFGYGFFDEMAAAYVMKYLDVTTTLEFVNLRLWTWKDGTQAIYEGVNKHLANPVILNTEVTKVERPEGGKVKVTIKNKDGEKVEEFDKLIVTTPLDRFTGYADASEDEKALFGMISARIAPAPSTPSAITKARAKPLTTTRSRPRRKIWPRAASRLPRVRLNGSATIAPTYPPKTTRMAGTTRSISSKARRIRITPAKSLASATWKRLAKSRKTSSSASSDPRMNKRPFPKLGNGFFRR